MRLDDSAKIEDLIDEFFGVKINNNKDCTISHNKIATQDKITLIQFNTPLTEGEEYNEVSSRSENTIDETENKIITGKLNRVIKNVDVFSRFMFNNSHKTSKPTIRVYGLFSNLSTNREKDSMTNNYNLLVLEEKSLLEQFIKDGYEVKVCISLDIDIIFDVWGYSPDQLKKRVIDLCSNLLILEKKFKNLKVSFDTHNRIDSMFILGDSIMIKAITASAGDGYSMTLYEDNKFLVDRAIKTFDETFYVAKQRDYAIRKQLYIDSIKDYIELLIEQRLKSAKGII